MFCGTDSSELKYSVLMSVYKKENPDFLRLALGSVVSQTVKPSEIVLVEDGPLTDELYSVIDDYKQYLKIVVNKENFGLGPALAKGLENCSNELIARMDTDDIALPDRCEKQLRFFSLHPETTILGGQIEEFITSPDEIIGKRIVPLSDSELKEYMKKRCPFNHMTVMFKKLDIIKAGNYRDWFWNEDYYLWIRLALKGFQFANLPDTLVYTRVGANMYNRRGGDKYFKSEMGIQKLMLENKIINRRTYVSNCLKRFVLQKLMPGKIRALAYKMFARKTKKGC